MRLLVIGGAGFIGPSVVATLLRGGHDVVVFHRGSERAAVPAGVGELIGDRRRLTESSRTLRETAPDVVIDLILSSGAQARDLLEVFRGVARRVVAVSSMDVYRACGVLHGLEPGGLEPLPLTEQSALRTATRTYPPGQVRVLQQVFGWLDDDYDKVAVEHEIRADPRLPATVLRLPMVYGPGDRLRRFYPIVKRVLDGRRSIPMSERMAQWRATKGFVENVGAAIARAASSDRAAGQTYNVGDADAMTELDWARQILAAMRWSGEIVVLPDDEVPLHLRAPGNADQHWVADTSRIREELELRDPVPRDEAIARTVAWEADTPPGGFMPHAFDYEAEDASCRAARLPGRRAPGESSREETAT